jgi:hypothetical protein
MAIAHTVPDTPAAPGTRRRARKRRRGRGVSPWISNQHGAWAMLITPAVLGLVAGVIAWIRGGVGPSGDLIALVAVLTAWFFGYGAFFAFGLAARARTPRRRRKYLAPVYVYGAVCLAALLIVVLARPATAWWALPYAPLVTVAVYETLRGRSRSLLSGVSTTIASALLVPVLADVGGATLTWTHGATVSAAFLALYFSGTIPFVKTMIREKGSESFLRLSVGVHVFSLVAVAAMVWAAPLNAWAATVMIAVMVIALARAVWFPVTAARGRAWTARDIGVAEVPVCLLAAVGVLLAVS